MDIQDSPPRTHEMSRVAGVHPKLRPGDVLVGDRGFCSFAHLALLLRDKLNAGLSNAVRGPRYDAAFHFGGGPEGQKRGQATLWPEK